MDHVGCECVCGARQFQVRFFRDEQVGLLTCAEGHHSLLLDSRDYWIDVLQDGRPKQSRCRCGGTLFQVDLAYEFREGGDVRSIEVSPICPECHRAQSPLLFEIKYGPTTELVSRPLDPIDQPWLKPKRRQITSYWKPSDAEQFASYIVERLGARVFLQRGYDTEECSFKTIEFYPELKHHLFFTIIPEIAPPKVRDPHKAAPFLHLSTSTHMMLYYPDGFGRLHYIEYSEQISRDAGLEEQPREFLKFARQTFEWLKQNYVSKRGRTTADNPEEYARFAQSAANTRRS